MSTLRKSLGTSLAATLFILTTSACTVDPTVVENTVKERLEKDGVEIDSLKCPAKRSRKKGTTFQCEGTSGLGDDFTVDVEMVDKKRAIRAIPCATATKAGGSFPASCTRSPSTQKS